MYCLRGTARYAGKDVDLTAWFLAHGADPNASCMLGLTPLTFAIRDADLSIIEMLFAHGGDVQQGYLLHAAVSRERDNSAILEYLIQKGAPVNAVQFYNRPGIYRMQETFGSGTALHDAAAAGRDDVLRVLISYGARLDIKDSCGDLAVELAEHCSHYGTAQYLRQQAARQRVALA